MKQRWSHPFGGAVLAEQSRFGRSFCGEVTLEPPALGAHFAALSLTKWPPSRAALNRIFRGQKITSLSKVIGKPASPLQRTTKPI